MSHQNGRPKVIAFVPLKLTNERLPGKNTKLLGGVAPLYHFILNSLLEVRSIDEVYVHCSEEKLDDLPSGANYSRRDKNLDGDNTSIIEVAKSFASEVEADVYLMAHATAPFLRRKTLELPVDSLVSAEFDSAMTVVSIRDFLWYQNEPINFDPNRIPRTQDLTGVFAETTGAYAFSKEVLEKDRRVGSNPYLLEVSRVEAVDINDELDWLLAESVFRANFEQ